MLWVLADVEFADGNFVAGRKCLDEALAASPPRPASLARQIRLRKPKREAAPSGRSYDPGRAQARLVLLEEQGILANNIRDCRS